MKRLFLIPLAALIVGMASGCDDDDRVVSPRDTTPPAAPRGLYSTTGDTEVFLRWLDNTESDVVGYRVYEAPCGTVGCAYDLVGTTTGLSFRVDGLTNGVTRHFAVAAYDRAGNESELSEFDVYDTPRPEGFDRAITNATDNPATAGWDFSAFAVRPWDHTSTDVYYSIANGERRMVAPFTDTQIQDAGFGSSLDAVDFAPVQGWSPSGTVELIVGHNYIVQIEEAPGVFHYAKFRVNSLSTAQVVFDWAYQTAPNNGELMQTPTRTNTTRVRRPVS